MKTMQQHPIRLLAIFAIVLAAVSLALLALHHQPASTALATNSVTDIPNPDAYTCSQPGFITFEALADGTNLSAGAIGGVQFTTTGGFTWLVGDFATNSYNGKFPSGSYTSQGTHWAWLGPNQGTGRIDFVNGPASYFSLLTSAFTPVSLDAYDAGGVLLETAGPSASNTGTGHMDELKISRPADIAYVIVHDLGNFFLIDSICTDAPGVPGGQQADLKKVSLAVAGSLSVNEDGSFAGGGFGNCADGLDNGQVPGAPTPPNQDDVVAPLAADGADMADPDCTRIPVSEQAFFDVVQVLHNNGPLPVVPTLDIKKIDCPDTNDAGQPSPTQCSVVFPTSLPFIVEVEVVGGVQYYFKQDRDRAFDHTCDAPKVPWFVGPGPFGVHTQIPTQDLPLVPLPPVGPLLHPNGIAQGDCIVADSTPGVFKELGIKKIINLPVSQPVTDGTTFDVHCLGPSFHTFTIQDEIRPLDPSITDPDLTNNALETKLTVACIAEADLKKTSIEIVPPAGTATAPITISATVTNIAPGKIPIPPPASICTHPCAVQNGDFVIKTTAGICCDGIDENTFWTFDFTTDPNYAAFPTTGPLTCAVLTLELTPEHRLISTDTVSMSESPLGSTSPEMNTMKIQLLPFPPGPPPPYVVTQDFLLDLGLINLNNPIGSPAEILAMFNNAVPNYPGQISMAYQDDAIVSSARLDLCADVPKINVSENVPISVSITIHNNGPFGPVTASDTMTASAPKDCSVTPPSAFGQFSLPVSYATSGPFAGFTIHCTKPSFHTFEFCDEIRPKDQHVIDPDPTNNRLCTTFTVAAIVYADVKKVSLEIIPPAAPMAPITISATATGSENPAQEVCPIDTLPIFTVMNGNFLITNPYCFNTPQPGPPLGTVGDGINENTTWTFDFTSDPNFAAFPTTGPLTCALLTLTLTPKHGLVTTDTVKIDDVTLPPIPIHPLFLSPFTFVPPLAVNVTSTTTPPLDLLTVPGYNSAAILGVFNAGTGGLIPMAYEDDAIVSFARLDLCAEVPAIPVSEQVFYDVVQVLHNNGPEPLVPTLDIKEVDCPDDPSLTECSVLIDPSIFEVSAQAGVPMYRKPGCVPPKIPIGVGPFQGPPAALGLAPGDCFVVDSVPGVIKELDVKKVIDLPISQPVTDRTTFDIHCTGPSFHTVTIQDEIRPLDPHIVDPDLSNNALERKMTLACVAEADVKILSFTCDPPAQIDVSMAVSMACAKTLHNNGPSDTVVHLVPSTTAPSDCEFSDDSDNLVANLPVSETVTVFEGFTMHCTDPSFHLFKVCNGIAMELHVVDPNPANNQESCVEFTVAAIAKADVKIVDFTCNAPQQIDVSVNVPVTCTKTLHNNGPFPTSVTLVWTASLPPDCGITSDFPNPKQFYLPVDANETVVEQFDIHCVQPSFHDILLCNEAQMKDLHVIDPNLGNNGPCVAFTLAAIAKADVKIINFTCPAPPQITVSVNVSVTCTELLHNNGPFAASVTVTGTAVAPLGCTVISPAFQVQLPVSTAVTITKTFIIHCTTPSFHVFTFANEVRVKDLHRIDLNLSNNRATAEFTVAVIAPADLKVTSVTTTCTDPVDINTPIACTVSGTVHNNGPFSPVNADVTVSLAVPPDCTAPAAQATNDLSLPASASVPVSKTFQTQCTNRSLHTFSGAISVALDHLHIIDDDSANNSGTGVDTAAVFNLADVKVTSTSISCPPSGTVGTPTSCTVTITIHNNGPTTPVDVGGALNVGYPDDCTVENYSPQGQGYGLLTLVASVSQTVVKTFNITCTLEGPHEVVGCGIVQVNQLHVRDPLAIGNNHGSTAPIVVVWSSGNTGNSLTLTAGRCDTFDPVEVCDGIDNDNDGFIDEEPDTDLDGTSDCVDVDDDNDGFSDEVEAYLGTNPLLACPAPPDFDSSQTVDISDALALKPVFGNAVPPAPVRLDIATGGSIDISDVLALKPYFNETCP